jgi:hypothetical protein
MAKQAKNRLGTETLTVTLGFVLVNGSMSSNQSGEVPFMSFDKAYCRQQCIQAEPNGKERGLT